MTTAQTTVTPVPSFETEAQARAWMHNELHNKDEHCIDNGRFAFINDEIGMQGYEDARDQGCCGFYDREVLVAGRKATVGCNYGH